MGWIFLGQIPRKSASFLEEVRAKTQEECGRGKKEDSLQDIRKESAGIDAELGEHDGDDMVPVVEEEPVQQSRQLPEEGDSGAVAKAEGAVAGIKKLQGRMKEKGQHVEGGEQIGEVALPVSKIMLEVVASELEGLDVFVG